MKSKVWSSKGILKPRTGERKFDLVRHPPSPDLSFFVQHYWIIRWNLQEPYAQETIPYPCVNLVMEPGQSRIYGVISGKFVRRLEGQGMVLGVKFRPGAFYPFWNAPVATLTDRSIPLGEVFGAEAEPLEQALFSAGADEPMVGLMEAFLREGLPGQDEQITVINQMVDWIISERTVTRVDDLANAFYVTKRSLQRLFNQYVGVGPKWVIKRYRLHEAAEQLADGEAVDWARMAQELGYFDQAHFIRDFKSIIGVTPAAYARYAAPQPRGWQTKNGQEPLPVS
jgi:AraC-like DNA-binding protein